MIFNKRRVFFSIKPLLFLVVFASAFFCLVFINPLFTSSALAVEIQVTLGHGSIQDAIDAASPGDIIVVDDGEYIENILLSKEVMLRSKHGSETTFLSPKDLNYPVISIVGASAAKVTGFTINSSKSSGIAAYRSSGVKIFSNYLTGHVNGLFFDNTNESAIFENVFIDNEKGVYLYFSDSNLIEKNGIDSNLNNGLLLHSSHKNIITENTINSNYWNGITLSSSNDNIIDGNEVINNTYAIVITDSTGNNLTNNRTMRRLYSILPVVLVYISIMVYLIERRLFIFFYNIKNKEHGKLQGLR